MRETAATTGASAEVGSGSVEDLEVSTDGSNPPETAEQLDQAAEPGDETSQAATDVAGGPDHRDGVGPVIDLDGHGGNDRPTFTRPPGMVPPPDRPDGAVGDLSSEEGVRLSAGATIATGSVGTASVPVSEHPVSSSPGMGTAPGDTRVRSLDPAVAIGSARVNEAVRPSRAPAGPRGPRRARLTLKRLDPWSVMKFSFAVSLVLFIVMIVAASVLYLALDAMGVFASVNNTLAELIETGGGAGGETFRITATWVIGTAASLGAINVVLFTALATLGAFVYNVCADLVGGVEVTLAERD